MKKYVFTSLLSLFVIVGFTSFMSPHKVSADFEEGPEVVFEDGGRSIVATFDHVFLFTLKYFEEEDGTGYEFEDISIQSSSDKCETENDGDIYTISCYQDIPFEVQSIVIDFMWKGESQGGYAPTLSSSDVYNRAFTYPEIIFEEGGRVVIINFDSEFYFDICYFDDDCLIYLSDGDSLGEECEIIGDYSVRCEQDIPKGALGVGVDVYDGDGNDFYDEYLFSTHNPSSSSISNIFGTRFCSAGVTTFCRPQNGFTNNNPLISIYTELLGLYQQLLSALQNENS
ncbi:MAG: hypothetical protein PHC89_01475 [Candidatus Pacebacteria bacterium]|nr:hypothetical protein [Candidatus Paceibacterota bacterium]